EYIHADQHIITFNPSNPNQLFAGCDGGVFRSNNRGYSFTYVPNNFVTFQFYDMDVAPDGSVLGGTQDNGSNFRTDAGNNSLNKATELLGGDGFDQYCSKKKPLTGLITMYNGVLLRFAINPANGNISAGPFYDNNIDKTGASSGPDDLPDDGVDFKWDLICHEPHQYNGDSAYTIIGTKKGLWITNGNTFNLGKTPRWKRVTPLTGPKAIQKASCFSIPVDADSVLYVGTKGGNVYRIKYFYSGDSLKISNSITRIFNASGRYITGLAANPKNPQQLYITLGSWQSGTSAPYIVKINDAATRTTVATVGSGATQLNAPGGTNGFPQCPAYCVEVNRYNTNQVFVGTELGVFASEDGGATWVSLNDFDGNTRPNGLPRVPVLSMKPLYYSAYVTIGTNNVPQYVFTGETDYLYLGTHGRGWYRTTSRINSITQNTAQYFTPEVNVYPNPTSDNLTMTMDLKNPTNLTIQILNLEGRAVQSTTYNAFAGNNNIQLNVSNLPNGIYVVTITGRDTRGQFINVSKKVSVIH
ncbi:MAG: T9SS type A sorting domain-containing protein, partial [Bacteroidia bacterium]|nr:T9SS type A sorting domain-containing protein [Bacteroidia bacterium]